MHSTGPESWTAAEVEDWLRRVKCAEYTAAFKRQGMDGMALAGLFRLASDVPYVLRLLKRDFEGEPAFSVGNRLRLIEEVNRLFS